MNAHTTTCASWHGGICDCSGNSGEVETPCATCGGTREVADYYSRQGAENGFSRPCPDCGVETPEAAVEAVAEAIYEGPQTSFAWQGVSELSRERFRAKARRAISALRAQGWTPPGGEEK